jgi:hypothetical protein
LYFLHCILDGISMVVGSDSTIMCIGMVAVAARRVLFPLVMISLVEQSFSESC